MFRKFISLIILFAFVCSLVTPVPKAQAQGILGLPEPGTIVSLSPAYQPTIIRGLTVHKDNPFLFDFIVDLGQDHLQGQALKNEGEKLIKYFLASLAIPERDLWVNLSPYEKDRIIPKALGQTDMGRDLLAQDYMLKQITASLIYPEKNLGRSFWDKVYASAQSKFGTTQIPVNTFNKVWIMADRAEVYERNQTVFVTNCHLKVMLEEDYLALQKHVSLHGGEFQSIRLPGDMFKSELQSTCPQAGCQASNPMNMKAPKGNSGSRNVTSQIIREIILPALEREVNQGKNFSNLRQIFNSIILSSWYKNNLKQALLNQVYANKEKVKGIEQSKEGLSPEQIYAQYLKAYKKGVFNFIKEDTVNGQAIPRKYFSGGVVPGAADQAQNVTVQNALSAVRGWSGKLVEINWGVKFADKIPSLNNPQARFDQIFTGGLISAKNLEDFITFSSSDDVLKEKEMFIREILTLLISLKIKLENVVKGKEGVNVSIVKEFLPRVDKSINNIALFVNQKAKISEEINGFLKVQNNSLYNEAFNKPSDKRDVIEYYFITSNKNDWPGILAQFGTYNKVYYQRLINKFEEYRSKDRAMLSERASTALDWFLGSTALAVGAMAISVPSYYYPDPYNPKAFVLGVVNVVYGGYLLKDHLFASKIDSINMKPEISPPDAAMVDFSKVLELDPSTNALVEEIIGKFSVNRNFQEENRLRYLIKLFYKRIIFERDFIEMINNSFKDKSLAKAIILETLKKSPESPLSKADAGMLAFFKRRVPITQDQLDFRFQQVLELFEKDISDRKAQKQLLDLIKFLSSEELLNPKTSLDTVQHAILLLVKLENKLKELIKTDEDNYKDFNKLVKDKQSLIAVIHMLVQFNIYEYRAREMEIWPRSLSAITVALKTIMYTRPQASDIASLEAHRDRVLNVKNSPGGIDLNTSKTVWSDHKEGAGVEMRVSAIGGSALGGDQAMIERVHSEGVDNLVPEIYSIIPISNIFSLIKS